MCIYILYVLQVCTHSLGIPSRTLLLFIRLYIYCYYFFYAVFLNFRCLYFSTRVKFAYYFLFFFFLTHTYLVSHRGPSAALVRRTRARFRTVTRCLTGARDPPDDWVQQNHLIWSRSPLRPCIQSGRPTVNILQLYYIIYNNAITGSINRTH